MQELAITGSTYEAVVSALATCPLFHAASPEELQWALSGAQLLQYDDLEPIAGQDEPADAYFVLVKGEATVLIRESDERWMAEVARYVAPTGFGEMGLLLGRPRSATVAASAGSIALRFSAEWFWGMFRGLPSFGPEVSRALAARLDALSAVLEVPRQEPPGVTPDPAALKLLPTRFLVRHRVLPLQSSGQQLTLGFVGDPTPHLLDHVRSLLPSMEIQSVQVSAAFFEQVAREGLGVGDLDDGSPSPARGDGEAAGEEEDIEVQRLTQGRAAPHLDAVLARMVQEGASDLHLCAGQVPRWRIDGELLELAEARPLEELEVYEMLRSTLTSHARAVLAKNNDVDFAYGIDDGSRFRVNLYRDHRGIGAAFRVIPSALMNPQQLGLPPVAQQFCHLPKGLILVTGPTGSGKSTTLAAMIDYINHHVPTHIITIEDPIEFVHESKRALVNQREVGHHTKSFARALRAALREDPDIVMVGEMRDPETVALALHTAATGHLVFGTMHTATAAGTVDRIIGMFSHEEQPQIRATASEVIKGIVCQTLCKREGGGRVAAFEVMVSNTAIANLMREQKTHHIPSAMSTAKKIGNVLLNADLARLVKQGKISVQEAMSKTVDKMELASHLSAEAAEEA